MFKVPLTPKNVFLLYKFPFSPDHHGEKIIVVAIFVGFLRLFKVYNFTLFHVHDRGIAENGPSRLRRHFGNNSVVFLPEKNICEHAIVCVKIVAECKGYELLETVAIQDTQDRVFFFIRYLYPDENRPETRKRPKK